MCLISSSPLWDRINRSLIRKKERNGKQKGKYDISYGKEIFCKTRAVKVLINVSNCIIQNLTRKKKNEIHQYNHSKLLFLKKWEVILFKLVYQNYQKKKSFVTENFDRWTFQNVGIIPNMTYSFVIGCPSLCIQMKSLICWHATVN